MLECIETLRAENELLRSKIKPKNEIRPILPKIVWERYKDGSIWTRRGRQPLRLSFFDVDDIRNLSHLVRSTCFTKTKKKSHGNVIGNTVSITLKAMSEEQYDRYSMIFGELLDVIKKYAIPVDERVQKE